MAGKKILLGIFIICIWPFVYAKPFIASFNMALRVDKDNLVSVRETILIEQEEGDEFQYPFSRSLPHYFIMEDGFPQLVQYNVLVVTDGVQKLPYKIIESEELMRIDIGKPKEIVKQKSFRIIIEYSAKNVIQFFNNYDMLRWQALFNRTDMPIKKTKIRMYTPEKGKIMTHEASLFQKNKEITLTFFRKVSDSGAYIFNQDTLNNNEGIEFMFSWPSGIVKPPNFYEKTYRILLRYPINVLYVVLLIFYLWSFIYIFCFQIEKNPIRFLKNVSPGTLYAICKEKFDFKSIFYSIVFLAGKGAIEINYKEGQYSLQFKGKSGLPILERVLYDILHRLSAKETLKVKDIRMTYSDWKQLSEAAAGEVKLPKAEKQKNFFYFIFLASSIILTYTFSRYDLIFCLSMLYLLVVIPFIIQRYFQKLTPFDVPKLPSNFKKIKNIVYGTNIFVSIILLVVSLHEIDYLIYRAPVREYEIFKLIGILNYASTAVYIFQAQRFFTKLRRATNEFRDYMIDPESHNFNDSRLSYDAVKLYSHFLPYAMIFKNEKKFGNYCVANNLRLGGGHYQVRWITIDGSTYNSFDEINDNLMSYFLLEIKKVLQKVSNKSDMDHLL